MKKLLLVDVPEGFTLEDTIFATNPNGEIVGGFKTNTLRALPTTELDPLTPEDINYFLTLHNNNGKGITYSPIPEGAETKLRRMLP